MRPSRPVITLPIGASSNDDAVELRLAAQRLRSCGARASARSARSVMSRMAPIVKVRSPICISLMPISIANRDPSLRQPSVSIGSAGLSPPRRSVRRHRRR